MSSAISSVGLGRNWPSDNYPYGIEYLTTAIPLIYWINWVLSKPSKVTERQSKQDDLN